MRFSPSFIVAHSSAEGRTDEHGIIITSNTIISSLEKCALSNSDSSLKSRLIQLLMLGHDPSWGLRIDAEKLNHVKWNGNNLDDQGVGRHETRRAWEVFLRFIGHEQWNIVTSEFDPVDHRNAEASRKCCQKHGIILAAEREVGRIDDTICSVWFDGWWSRRGHDECHKLARIIFLFNLSKNFLVALCWLFVRRPWHLFLCLIDWRSLPPETRSENGLRDKFTSSRCIGAGVKHVAPALTFACSHACMHNFEFTSCLWSHSEVAKIIFTLESHWFMVENCRLKRKTRKCDRFWL